MLVQDHEPLEHRCRAAWSVVAAAVMAGVAVATAGLELYASPTRQETVAMQEKPTPDAPRPDDKAKPEVPKEKAYHYSGKVKELGTGKPIAGANVVVRRQLLSRDHQRKVLEESKHTTDAEGRYSFTIPPEQAAERYLYIELDVEHPDYATQAGFGYSFTMIRKNETMGGRPFFESIELRPGKPIAGMVERPDGSPAKGVSILAYSRSGKLGEGAGPIEYGSFTKAKTDDSGHFKLNVTTPGLAVFWILPDDLAPELHGVHEGRRGELGRFTLKPGTSLHGRVLDVDGKPVAGIYVNAERDQDEEVGKILGGLAVADAVNRTAITGADGTFTLAPLPAGSYRITPASQAREGWERNTERPLTSVFIPTKVAIKEGSTGEPIEIRAAPHVVIETQWLDGQGKPTKGFSSHIFGQIDGGFWMGEAKVDDNGKCVINVPHGLENTQVSLMTNEHHAIQWRKAKGEPLSRQRQINLGTLDHDMKGIEIIHYNAPIVMVKAETRDHKPVADFKVTLEYTEAEKDNREGKLILAGGMHSDASFEKQEDGRYRSEQLQPGLEFRVTAHAEKFQPASRTLRLAEGKTEEFTLVLEPK